MSILDKEFIKGFCRVCEDGFDLGWHERNGGNLTYRMKQEEVDQISIGFNSGGDWMDIGTCVPGLANEYFLVTGSGKYLRNVPIDPKRNIAIIKLDEAGEKYKIMWGLTDGCKPTSELPTHLMNHEVKKTLTDGVHRVIYHCHATNIIALTFVLPLEDKIFTRELWEMSSECAVVIPAGVGVVGWRVPGGRDIAVATSELMKKHDVAIWAHHGIFCSGENFDNTFGLAHTVEKAAEILVKVRSMQSQKSNTITTDNLRAIAKDFHLNLPEDYLK